MEAYLCPIMRFVKSDAQLWMQSLHCYRSRLREVPGIGPQTATALMVAARGRTEERMLGWSLAIHTTVAGRLSLRGYRSADWRILLMTGRQVGRTGVAGKSENCRTGNAGISTPAGILFSRPHFGG